MPFTFEIRGLTTDQIRSVADVLEKGGVPLSNYADLGITPVIETGVETREGRFPDRLIAFESFVPETSDAMVHR